MITLYLLGSDEDLRSQTNFDTELIMEFMDFLKMKGNINL